jgi:general secretion pathway protein B
MLVWAGVAHAAALVVAVACNFVGGARPSPRPVAEGSVSPAPPVVAPVPLPAMPSPAEAPPPAATTAPGATTAHAPPSTQRSTDPAPVAPAPEHPPRAAPRHAPEPKRTARRNAETETAPAPAKTAAANTATAKVPEQKSEPKATRSPSEGRVYQQAELPDDVRRDLPKLVIGGASYSGDPASRMVMINGQVFHEGDQLAPQLVLERIKLKSAVLSYKGYRYEVTF